MARRISLETIHEVVRRWRDGQSQRGIAEDLQLSRHTVQRVLSDHHQARQRDPCRRDPSGEQPDRQCEAKRAPRRASQLDAFEAPISELLDRYPQITVVRLLEELRQVGYQGGYTILRQRVRQLRGKAKSPFVRRFETGPGAQAQMDYAVYDLDFSEQGRRRVYLFSYLLGYSRRQYLRFVESQDMQTTLREHVSAFDHLQGVAAVCLYDNMKVVVSRYEQGEPIYNTQFLSFATHYGFRPRACRPRRPQTKGKVERPFDYVEKNLLNGRSFRSLEHLNQVTAWWLAEVADVRIHRTTGERPIDRHAQEQPHLIPLPQTAFDPSPIVYRIVDAEGLIHLDSNGYSVPWDATHPGQTLAVKIGQQELIIYGADLDELARHVRFPHSVSRQTSRLPQHAPPPSSRRRRQQLQQQFASWGEVGQAFWEGLEKSHRYVLVHAQRVVACLTLYRRQDLLAALQRAVRHGAFSADAVERILALRARPRSTDDRLQEQEQARWRNWDSPPPPAQRSAAAYQTLLFGEPPEEPTTEPTQPTEPPQRPSETGEENDDAQNKLEDGGPQNGLQNGEQDSSSEESP